MSIDMRLIMTIVVVIAVVLLFYIEILFSQPDSISLCQLVQISSC